MADFNEVNEQIGKEFTSITQFVDTSTTNVQTFLAGLGPIIQSLKNYIADTFDVDEDLTSFFFIPEAITITPRSSASEKEPSIDESERAFIPSGQDTPVITDPSYNFDPVSWDAIPAFKPISMISPNQWEFKWAELYYDDPSGLNDEVASQLLFDILNGPDGLNIDWENQMILKGQEHDEKALQLEIQKHGDAAASMNFDLPQGALSEKVSAVILAYNLKKMEQSKEIFVQQFKESLEYAKFTVTTGLSYEKMMLLHWENIQNRSLDAAKAVVQFAIAVYNTYVASYNAYVNSLTIQYGLLNEQSRLDLAVHNLQLEAWSAQLEQYKTKFDLIFKQIALMLSKYGIDINIYGHQVALGTAQQDVLEKQDEFSQRTYEYNYNMALQNAKFGLTTFLRYAEIQTRTAEAGGGIWAHIAQGTFNALNSLITLGDNVLANAAPPATGTSGTP